MKLPSLTGDVHAVARFAAMAALLLGAGAHAYESIGTVSQLVVVGSNGGAPGNYDLRVLPVITGGPNNPLPASCSGGFIYLNVTDANYNALAANLLAAKVSGASSMDFIYEQSGSFCVLQWITW